MSILFPIAIILEHAKKMLINDVKADIYILKIFILVHLVHFLQIKMSPYPIVIEIHDSDVFETLRWDVSWDF